ncbi:MAG: DUF6077 domain-containing protein [Thermoanaerobaculia bacterium]|nr:DUF6077 domain-containing protein [Thermoanaerobaculia bacterium]
MTESPHWSERVVTVWAVGLAAWTLCSQAVGFLGGTFLQLLGLAAFALAVSGLCLRLASSRRESSLSSPQDTCSERVAQPNSPEEADTFAETAAHRDAAHLRGVSGIPAAVLLSSFAGIALLQHEPLALWWWVTGCVGLGVFVSYREPATIRVAEVGPYGKWLLALSILCTVFALMAHRPDADDAFYVNLAAAAIDRPDLPLFGRDTLHGLPSPAVPFSVYRLHSWELLNGAIGFVAGISALASFHFVSVCLVAFLAPFAWATLLRRIVPKAWFPTLVALLLILVMVGDAHRWYGNFAFVRIWQGKSVFLTILLPLIWAWSIRFAQDPTWRSAALTLVGQVAAVGTTSTAVWAAPVALAVGILAGMAKKNLKFVAMGLIAVSSYPLTMGLVVKSGMRGVSERVVATLETLAANSSSSVSSSPLLEAFTIVCGSHWTVLASLAAIAGAWTVLPAGTARRFASVSILVPWTTVLNPYLHPLVASQVSGPSYWRTLWVLPIPLCIAFLIAAIWSRCRQRSIKWLLSLLLIGGFSLLPAAPGWSHQNQGLVFDWPRYKVPGHLLSQASLLRATVPEGAVVVATTDGATWTTVLQEHPHPVAVRGYLRLNGPARLDRFGMRAIADGRGRTERRLEDFRAALWRYRVEAVLFEKSRGSESLEQVLRLAAFEKAVDSKRFQIWVRRGLDPQGDPTPMLPLAWH